MPVRNDAEGLARCLRSIRDDAATPDLEILVGDNGSSDGSPAAARSFGARVTVLEGLRVGAVRNHVAREATTARLLFVDADHEVAPGWMQAALDSMTPTDVGVAGAPYQSPPNPTWVQRVYGAMRVMPDRVTDTAWLGAGNMAVRREVFERVGGFDESLEACEDVDFCIRVRRAGWRVVAVPGMRSVHHGDPRTLRALFRGERWRGRDNLRVSLRGPLTLRDLPSVLVPVVDLLVLAVVCVGCVVPAARMFAIGAALVFAVFTALRAVVLMRRLGGGLLVGLQALAVSATYDVARALALVTRAPHRRATAVTR